MLALRHSSAQWAASNCQFWQQPSDDLEVNMCLGVPGQVKQIYEANGTRMGKVNFGGIVKEVCLAYVPELAVGDYTIVHVGFALTKIDEASANETLKMFRDLGILEEELNPEDPAESQLAPACAVDLFGLTQGAKQIVAA